MLKNIKEMLKDIDIAEKRITEIPTEQGNIDAALNDILHVIEFNSFDACSGFKLAKMIKDKRQERRALKDELDETLEIVELGKRVKGTLETYKVKLGQLKAKQDAKIYKVRVMQEAFGEVVEGKSNK